MRAFQSSLRLRLLGGAVLAIFLALTLAGLGFSWLFHRHVERQEVADLTGVGKQIVAGLTLDPTGRVAVSPPPAHPDFDRIAGGRYWQAIGPAGTTQSASLWDQSLPVLRVPRKDWTVFTVAGPFEKRLLIVGRQVEPNAGGPAVVVLAAKDDTEMRAALREFDLEMALSLALLWIVLSIAAYVQVVLGLRPLDRVRRELDRLRRSPVARLPRLRLNEVDPLIDAINALAHAREDDLIRARRRAADLAHSLKTPLSVLAAQSRRAREQGARAAADGLDRAIEAVNASLEAELARSRAAAARQSVPSQVSSPAVIVEQLIGVIERTQHGEAIAFSTDVDPDIELPVDSADLTEMLGALLENAVRHASRQVAVRGDTAEGWRSVTIEDDGPGMDEALLENAVVRGVRLDETGAGHGLGLAIVRDLAEATGGTLRLGRSTLGGLAASLAWKDR